MQNELNGILKLTLGVSSTSFNNYNETLLIQMFYKYGQHLNNTYR